MSATIFAVLTNPMLQEARFSYHLLQSVCITVCIIDAMEKETCDLPSNTNVLCDKKLS